MSDGNYFKDKKEAMRLVRTFFREHEVKKARNILKEFLNWMYKARYFIGWK